MNLIIDAGNQRIKLAIYSGASILANYTMRNGEAFPEEWAAYSFTNGIISNTGAEINIINLPGIPFIQMDARTPLPIISAYQSPETLGNDRKAASVAARAFATSNAVLSIDAGTCITYDFIADDVYQGGAISPGVEMRLKAMAHFTSRLPLVALNPAVALTGTDTESCLQSGAMHGVIQEINGVIEEYKKQYPDIQVFATGGDLPYFENRLKHNIFARPNLVLEGLNAILLHNLSH